MKKKPKICKYNAKKKESFFSKLLMNQKSLINKIISTLNENNYQKKRLSIREFSILITDSVYYLINSILFDKIFMQIIHLKRILKLIIYNYAY